MLKKVSVLGGKFCHHNMTSPHISPLSPPPNPSCHPSHSQSQWPHMHNPPIIMLCQIHNLPYHPHLHGSHVINIPWDAMPQAPHVATLLWPSVGVKPNTWKKWGFGVLWDSRMFRVRQKRPKHLALRCSWCRWKALEV
jgi:hypothetical protein